MYKNIISVQVCNSIQPFHYHEDILELIFVLKGALTCTIINKSVELSEGDLYLINRDETHCIESSSDELIFLEFHFNMKLFERYIPSVEITYFMADAFIHNDTATSFKAEIQESLCTLIGLMNDDVYLSQRENDIINLGIDIINSLKFHFNIVGKNPVSMINASESPDSATINSKDNDSNPFYQIWEIIEYIYNNNNHKLSLKECADCFYISETYLARIIKENLNFSFRDFLAYTRVEDSIKKLLGTDMSITNIAYECGFSAPRYYISTFEKYYHCTPSEYRKKNKAFYQEYKHLNNNGLTFQPNINKSSIYNLLQRYKNNILTNYVEIYWDITKYYSQNRINAYHKPTLKCTTTEALDFSNQELFATCRQGLELTEAYIVPDFLNRREMNSIALSNLKHMGFNIINTPENSIPFHSLFSKSGVKTYDYYKHEIFNKIVTPFTQSHNNVILYQKGEHHFAVLYNWDNESTFKHTLNVTGLDIEKSYVLIRTKVGMLPPNINHDSISIELLKTITKPDTDIEFINERKSILIEETLKPNDICLIKIAPLP